MKSLIQLLFIGVLIAIFVPGQHPSKIRRDIEELESSLRFKNRVLSVIAHDLKNPVASVAQFSDKGFKIEDCICSGLRYPNIIDILEQEISWCAANK